MKFSKQEFFLGSLAVAVLVFKIGWWILVMSPLCGLLWMLGGTINKAIRRHGVPTTVFLCSVSLGPSWWDGLIIPLGFAILCLGDGYADPLTHDEGSWLGQRVKTTGWFDNETGGLVTKLLVVVLFQIALVPVFWK